MGSAGFTDTDLAKYPFLKQTGEQIKKLELTLEALVGPENAQILDRAEKRVENAILTVTIGKKAHDNIEIPSFPAAIVLVAATENSLIKKRYALAEAKQASSDLADESKEKILKIALDFDWKLRLTPKESSDSPSEFIVYFTDYLRNTSHLHDKKWKLTNSILSKGNIYLNKKDAARLLEEEIRRRIEKRLEVKLPKYPTEIGFMAERIKKTCYGNDWAKRNGRVAKSGGSSGFSTMHKCVVRGCSLKPPSLTHWPFYFNLFSS